MSNADSPAPPPAVKILGFGLGLGAFIGVMAGVVVLARQHIPIDLAAPGLGVVLFGVASGMAGIDFAALLHRSRTARRFAAGTLSWLLAVAAYIGLADPFAPYIRFDDGLLIAKWLGVPPLAVLGLFGLMALWRRRAQRQK